MVWIHWPCLWYDDWVGWMASPLTGEGELAGLFTGEDLELKYFSMDKSQRDRRTVRIDALGSTLA